MKLKELLPLIRGRYDVYYKGQWLGDYTSDIDAIDKFLPKWALECRVKEITTDDEVNEYQSVEIYLGE